MNEHATLTIEGRELEVVALDGREVISELFAYDISCTDDLEPRSLLGRQASITLLACALSRTIEGIVTRAERHASDDGSVTLSLSVRPRVFPLTLGRGSRAFQNKNVVGIVDQLLATSPHRWELAESYETYEYRAQYREDDWTYVARLLDEEGIYFWFDHDDASELVLADDSRAASELALLDFAFESQLTTSREQCFELASEARATATRFSVGSFDPRRPALKLAESAGSGSLAHYDAPGAGPRSPDACARRAALLQRVARAARSAVHGASSSARLTPGRAVTISGHPLARFDRRYLITEVSYRVAQRRRNSEERPFICRFRALPLDVAFHPATHLPAARQAGLQSGVVVGAPGEEIFPDSEGRVRVQLHWDREGARDASSGHWMRVAQRGTAGSMLLPRVGWNILTFNEEGSVDEPSALSRIHDAEHPPSYALPGSKTRMVFKTATSPGGGSANEIYFEDNKGAEQMFMNASRDMSLLVQKDKSEQIGGCLSRSIAVDHDLAVGDVFGEIVSGDQSIQVAGNELLRLVGDEGKCVVGNESETIGASRSLETGGAHQIMVGASRNLQVGSALIDTVMGPISCASGSSTHVMVGAAAIRTSAQAISESVSGGSLQAIGGAKLELTAGARSISARFLHNEVVGGALVLKTAENLTSKTKVATSYTVGAMMSAKAPELLIEAEESIVLTCGKSALIITKDEVELRTKDLKVDDSAKVIDADSKLITHN
ncbi:MAG TPA: type VI secretion system tip protein TssI/VgrG [Polyangiaceae bacterium]|nr:type VI secretion system tip protein TssI/VgrG [Polyangiaceae bacterium]